jgi:transposase
MSQNLNSAVSVIGIDLGKNSFHAVGLDDRGAIVPLCGVGVSRDC